MPGIDQKEEKHVVAFYLLATASFLLFSLSPPRLGQEKGRRRMLGQEVADHGGGRLFGTIKPEVFGRQSKSGAFASLQRDATVFREFESSSCCSEENGDSKRQQQEEERQQRQYISGFDLEGNPIYDEKRNEEEAAAAALREKKKKELREKIMQKEKEFIIMPKGSRSWRSILLNYSKSCQVEGLNTMFQARTTIKNNKTSLGPMRTYGLIDPATGRRILLDDDPRDYKLGSRELSSSLSSWISKVEHARAAATYNGSSSNRSSISDIDGRMMMSPEERIKLIRNRRKGMGGPFVESWSNPGEFQEILKMYPDPPKLDSDSLPPEKFALGVLRGMGFNTSDPSIFNKSSSSKRIVPWMGRRGVGFLPKLEPKWRSPTSKALNKRFPSRIDAKDSADEKTEMHRNLPPSQQSPSSSASSPSSSSSYSSSYSYSEEESSAVDRTAADAESFKAGDSRHDSRTSSRTRSRKSKRRRKMRRRSGSKSQRNIENGRNDKKGTKKKSKRKSKMRSRSSKETAEQNVRKRR